MTSGSSGAARALTEALSSGRPDAVAAALRDLDGVAAAHATAYERLRARFCPLADGRATARVIDAVIGRW